MDFHKNLFILILCILQMSYVSLLKDPKIVFFESNGFDILLEDRNKDEFEYILITGRITCHNPHHQKLNFSNLMKFDNGKWRYKNLSMRNCYEGMLNYELIEQPKATGVLKNTSKGYIIINNLDEEKLSEKPISDEPLMNLRSNLTDSIENQKDGNINNNKSNIKPIIPKCTESKTTVRGTSACAESLIFLDNFNSFNTMLWEREIKLSSDSSDAEFVSYQNKSENLFIENGKLHIVPSLLSNFPGFNEHFIRRGILDLGEICTGTSYLTECQRNASWTKILPPVVSAKIRTKDKFSFRYGKIEVRAKLPIGDWLFPQILLEPQANDYGIENYDSGQMRVAFIRGNENLDTKDGLQIDGSKLSGGVILSSGESYRSLWMKSTIQSEHFGKKFHTYVLTWTDESITLEVDDSIYGTLRGNFKSIPAISEILHTKLWRNKMSPFDKEFYLSLGVGAGGISDFPDESLNGPRKLIKPWDNTDPKNELNFWKDHNNWYQTWSEDDAKLIIDYVKVWAL